MAEHIHYSWEELWQEWMSEPGFAEAYEQSRQGFELGETVVKLRQQRGWSQRRLAKAAGIPESVLDDLELGVPDPPIDVLKRVAKALGTELEVRFKPQDRSSVS